MKAKVTGIEHNKDFKDADHIAEYWKAGKAQFNVNVPVQDSENATKCVFKNDLNSPFVTKNGQLNLGTGVEYTYEFSKENEKVTKVGDYTVKFTIADNVLSAAIQKADKSGYEDAEEVAKITNDENATAAPYNYVELQNTKTAKKLLNTGVFDVLYSVSAKACSAKITEKNEVNVTFDGKDYFTATFVQPVTVAAKAADKFIDGVDFGEAGSFVKLEDLIAPSDWRGRAFSDHTNYWKYYGVSKITVLDGAKCNLNHSSEMVDLPATIELKQENASNNVFYTWGKDSEGNAEKKFIKSDYGFLTYKNNGTSTQEDFNIYVKVTVEYKWGTIATDYITVPVAKTIK